MKDLYPESLLGGGDIGAENLKVFLGSHLVNYSMRMWNSEKQDRGASCRSVNPSQTYPIFKVYLILPSGYKEQKQGLCTAVLWVCLRASWRATLRDDGMVWAQNKPHRQQGVLILPVLSARVWNCRWWGTSLPWGLLYCFNNWSYLTLILTDFNFRLYLVNDHFVCNSVYDSFIVDCIKDLNIFKLPEYFLFVWTLI